MTSFGTSSSGPNQAQGQAGALFNQAATNELYDRRMVSPGQSYVDPQTGQTVTTEPEYEYEFRQIDVPEYYPGQNYVGMSGDTATGIGRMRQRADGTEAQRQIGGLGSQFLQGRAPGAGVAGQAQGAFGSGVSGLEGMAAGGGPAGGAQANQALAGYASGRVNPLTAQMFQAASNELNESFQRDTLPGIQDMFAGSGGAGSSLAAGATGQAAGDLADAQANMAAQMFGGAAESALDRGVGAASTLGSLYDAQQGRQLSAADRLAGLGMRGAQMADQQALTGAQLAGQADALERQGIQDLFGAGQIAEEAQGRQIAGDMERYNYTANMDQMQRDRNLAAQASIPQALSGLPGVASSVRMGIK